MTKKHSSILGFQLTIDRARQLLWVVILIFIMFTLLKVWPLLKGYDTAQVTLYFGSDEDARISKLDSVLLEHLSHLTYTRAFDQSLSRGMRTLKLDKPIWVDRCEVNQGDFYKFSRWQPFAPNQVKPAPRQPDDWQYLSESRNHVISGKLNAAANAITWFDAYAYCQTAGGRLLDLDEWLATAGGSAQRLYPWGDDFRADAWPYLNPLLNATQKCGLHPATDTPEGVADLGGNVSEWVASKKHPNAALIAGGNAFGSPRALHSLNMLYRQAPAQFRSPYIGFRCAYDSTPRAITAWRADLDARAIPAGSYEVGVAANARLPKLITAIPPNRLNLIQRIFKRDDKANKEESFYITTGEITRRQYAAFLRDPFVKLGLYAEASEPKNHRYKPPTWNQQKYNLDVAVTDINWWSAYAFAAWAGGRLPTTEEWASAASGQGQRLYPWGEQFDARLAVTAEHQKTEPLPLDNSRGDVTPEGIRDLGGNVSEWTRSVASADGVYSIVVKGGNYLLPGKFTTRFDYSTLVVPHYKSRAIGFRVVFDRQR